MTVFKNLLTIAILWCLAVIVFSTENIHAQTLPKDSLSTDTLVKDTLKTGVSNDIKSKVHYVADDTIEFDVEHERVFMYEKAQVNYENIELKAAYIEVDWNTKNVFSAGLRDSTGKLYGMPVFKEGDDEFKADTMRYNFGTKKGKVYHVVTQQGDGFIHGAIVKKVEESSYIRYGKYTTCSLDTPHYYIAANKLKVIPNNKIITGPAYLIIGDVPAPAAIPFGLFPNTKGRSSGILFPAYGESNALGFFFKNGGYYFGISDHVDLQLTADIYTLGSWAVKATSRYNNRYHYNGNLSFLYSIIKVSEKDLPDYSRSKEFFINWSHLQDPKARPNGIFSASVRAGSNDYYTRNISNASNYLTNTFNSSISYSRSFFNKQLNFSSAITHSQNTQTRIVYLTAPSINLSMNTLYPFRKKEQEGTLAWYEKISVGYSSTLQNQLQNPDSLFFKNATLQQMKNGMQHNIPISASFKVMKYFNLTPAINFNERWYIETYKQRFNADSNRIITDTVKGFNAAHEYNGSLSLNTRIYGMKQFKKGKIAAIRHVLSPTLSYMYRPDFGENKYGYYKTVQTDSLGNSRRYSIYENTLYGGPSLGKSNVLSFSLDNNLEMKTRQYTDTAVNIKKIKILESFGLSASYNLSADSFNLSPIGMSARTTLFDMVNLTASGTFDPYLMNDQGIRIAKYSLAENGKIARLTSASGSVGFNLNRQKGNKKSLKGTVEQVKEINDHPDDYVDFSVPYNLSVNYSIAYSRPTNEKGNLSQIVGFNGDISLTEHWKITFNSGYDFQTKKQSYTSLGFYRDLHCWEMRLNWVPFGYQANYYFQINVKSSVLQDLKLTKKNDRYDNF